MEQEPKIESRANTLSIEYLTGLWDLPREQVLEKILKEKGSLRDCQRRNPSVKRCCPCGREII